MVAPAHWVPGAWGAELPVGGHLGDGSLRIENKNENVYQHRDHSSQPKPTSTMPMMHVEPDDDFSEGMMHEQEQELLQAFSMESFVDRLVEDDPPPWRGSDGSGGRDGGGVRLWEAPAALTPAAGVYNGGAPAAAKLFLQPIYSWPPGACGDAYDGAGEGNCGQDMPIVVPHDPILDALFTPTRLSPEIVPAVTLGLMGQSVGEGYRCSSGGYCDGGSGSISEFAPGALTGYFPPPQLLPVPAPSTAVLVPMAPLSRYDLPLCQPGAPSRLAPPATAAAAAINTSTTTVITSVQHQHPVFGLHLHQHHDYHQDYYHDYPPQLLPPIQQEKPKELGAPPKNICDTTLLPTGGTNDAAGVSLSPASPPLTGADSFSEEYDDETATFLRQQELAMFVGPGYLAGPGRPGLMTPAARAALVDWLGRVHAAAPSASGGAGTPLSLEALFLAVHLMDRFLSTPEGAKIAFVGGPALKVAAAASLALASKYEDTQPPSLWGVAAAASGGAQENVTGEGGVCSCGGGGNFGGGGGVVAGIACIACQAEGDIRDARREVAAMEMRVASALGFRLTVPTALSFLGVFLRRAEGLGYLPARAATETVRTEATTILLCVLRDASSLDHLPSALAAAALYWASCVTSPGEAAPGTFAFFAVTGYQLDRLCRCLRDMENVRTGGGGSAFGGSGGGWASAAFPEHADNSLFGAGGGHPAIAAL